MDAGRLGLGRRARSPSRAGVGHGDGRRLDAPSLSQWTAARDVNTARASRLIARTTSIGSISPSPHPINAASAFNDALAKTRAPSIRYQYASFAEDGDVALGSQVRGLAYR